MVTSLIKPSHAHIWVINLLEFVAEEASLFMLLSPDEVERAKRLQFALHKQRFIITHGMLRKILSLYTGIAPSKITFATGPYGKPYLLDNTLNLHFNISHSADMALVAITTQQEIGVDIERIEHPVKNELAERFFTANEYAELIALPTDEQLKGFYQIWSKKEAVIKALGHSLALSLSSFSVSLLPAGDIIINNGQNYHIQSLQVPEGYIGALATAKQAEAIIYKQGPEALT